MAGLEHEVLELMGLVHEDMVDTHIPEINIIILFFSDVSHDTLQFGLQVLLALFQT